MLHSILYERLRHLGLTERLVQVATQRFMDLRDKKLRLEKAPATGELLAWVKVLIRAGVDPDLLSQIDLPELPALGALLKNKSDMDAVRKSAA
jgi:hypothetical protein